MPVRCTFAAMHGCHKQAAVDHADKNNDNRSEPSQAALWSPNGRACMSLISNSASMLCGKGTQD